MGGSPPPVIVKPCVLQVDWDWDQEAQEEQGNPPPGLVLVTTAVVGLISHYSGSKLYTGVKGGLLTRTGSVDRPLGVI